MLNLGLYLQRILRAYKIYTEFFPWETFWNDDLFYLTLYIDLYLLLNSLSDVVMILHYGLLQVYKIIGDASSLSNTV